MRNRKADRFDEFVAQLSTAACRRLDKAHLMRHPTAGRLYLEFLKPMMEDIGETDADQLLLAGQYNFEETVSIIETMGFWGFAHPATGVIHCWWNSHCPRRQLVAFVCHELEHIVASCRPKDEEKRCDLTAAIAVRAMELLEL